MTPLEEAAVALHYHVDGMSVEEAVDLLKGTGIAPLEESEDWDA